MPEPKREPTDERRKAMEKLLGEPFVGGLTDEVAKTRIRLLVFASLSVAIVAFNLRIKPDSSILGLQIVNLDDRVVRWGLAVVVAYLLAHFVLGAIESAAEWKLRLTGMKKWSAGPEREGGVGTGADYFGPDDRNSTLFRWLKMLVAERGQWVPERLDDRLQVSLRRFDNWFDFLLRTQSLRWLLFDLALPCVMGIAALVLLTTGTWPALQRCFGST